ncbi:MAG: nicotinate-nucleotide adenylyltransferase [Acidimicrobiales bacterium]
MASRPVRLGLLGGTFDPVHVGHVVAAAEARHALALDTVLLVVANRPWQKEGTRPITPALDRLAMVEAAVDGVDGLEATAIEIERGGLSYTADTVAELAALHPGAELFLLVGADVAADLGTWTRQDELHRAVTIAVITRAGEPPPRPLPPWRTVVVDMPALEVSSRDLRARVAAGRPLDGLVPPGALDELRRRGLYAGGG